MSKTSICGNHRLVVLIAIMFLVALATEVPLVSAQDTQGNANGEMQNTNKPETSTSGKKSTKKRGKQTSKAEKTASGETTDSTGAATTNASQDSTGAASTTNANTATDATNISAEEPTAPKRSGRRHRGSGSKAKAGASSEAVGVDPAMAGAQADLSGTYDGVVNYPEGGLSGPATLAVTGNQFTLTPEGGSPVTGNISAVTTRGYTGVAMQMGSPASTGSSQPAAAPTTVSVRLRKTSKGIVLTPASGSEHQFSFKTGGKKQ